MKIIDTFKLAIKEGMDAAALIEKASERAEAYAAIANAIATSGVLKRDALLEEELPKGKESLKPETSKKRGANKKKPVEAPTLVEEEAVVEEVPVVEEVVEPVTEEVVEEEQVIEVNEEIPAQEVPVVEEVIQEETEVPVVEEEEITAEWTDEALEQFAEEREFLNAVLEEYDEQSVADQLSWWSEGVYTSIEDISPLNIAGFVAFLKSEFGEE